jgi:hypothetical protein
MSMSGVTSGAGTANPSEKPDFTPVFSGVHVPQSLVFWVVFCKSLSVSFILSMVLAVLLRFTASDYPFGIFKLFCFPTHGCSLHCYLQNMFCGSLHSKTIVQGT